jgi:hypothetical protein
MAGNAGGPWGGGGGNKGGDDDRRNNGGGRRPGDDGGPQIPEIDDLMRKGQEQLRVLMGGRGGRGGTGGSGGEGGPTRADLHPLDAGSGPVGGFGPLGVQQLLYGASRKNNRWSCFWASSTRSVAPV